MIGGLTIIYFYVSYSHTVYIKTRSSSAIKVI